MSITVAARTSSMVSAEYVISLCANRAKRPRLMSGAPKPSAAFLRRERREITVTAGTKKYITYNRIDDSSSLFARFVVVAGRAVHSSRERQSGDPAWQGLGFPLSHSQNTRALGIASHVQSSRYR